MKVLDKDKIRKYLLGRKDTLYKEYQNQCTKEFECTEMDDVLEAQRQQVIISSAIDEVTMMLDNLDEYIYDVTSVAKGGAIIFRIENDVISDDGFISEWLRIYDELKKSDITAIAISYVDFDNYDDKIQLAQELEREANKLRGVVEANERG